MNLQDNLNILFLGDVIGKPGRRAIKQFLSEHTEIAELIIANAENSAHGFGTTESNLEELRESGVHAFTGGNHTFDRKEIFEFIDRQQNVIRPANYPEGTPGQGYCLLNVGADVKVLLINVLGRVFMEPLESPFLVADKILSMYADQTKIVIVDVHAEATAEKIALGLYLDGRVSAVFGTHTHVQTADERILPEGTAFITDLGCCGPINSVIGMDKEAVFKRMVKQLPARFEVASGPAMVNGVVVTINKSSGKAIAIRRVHFEESSGNSDDQDDSSRPSKLELSQQV